MDCTSSMLRGLVIAGWVLLGPAIAAGDPGAPELRQIDEAGKAPLYGFVGKTRSDGAVLARQVLPAPDQPNTDLGELGDEPPQAIAQSRIVYLNKDGVTLLPGDNDARVNRSSIVKQQTAIPAWNITPANWNTVVTCMRDLFAAYDLRIVDSDPGNVPHMEAVFGGSPTQVALDSSVLGVSPFTLDCVVIENSVVFTFTTGTTVQMSLRETCETMAQEVAHSFGLDHELLASDPMTYLPYSGNRTFKDLAASCGEDTPRNCGINGSVCRANQNSVALLRDRLGIADAIAPLLDITSPPDHAVVPPGFQVRANGTDNNIVVGATLKIDGILREQLGGTGPFVFTTPALTDGEHSIVVEINDGKNFKSDTRTVTVMKGAPPLPGEGDPLENDVVGGCAATDPHASALLALGLAAVIARRRRRR